MSIADVEYIEPASRMHLAETLSDLSNTASTIVLLVGELGSGRSFLLDQIEDLNDSRSQQIVRIILKEKTSVSRVLQALSGALEIDTDSFSDNQEYMLAIHNQLISMFEDGFIVKLQIDDADFLTNNALESLLTLTLLPNTSLSVVLTALPEFDLLVSELGALERYQPNVHKEYLEPFCEEEVEVSKGQPGRIIEAVDRLIKRGDYLKNFPLPKIHLVLILGVLAGLLIWYLVSGSGSTSNSQDTIRVSVTPQASQIQLPNSSASEEVSSSQFNSEELETHQLELSPVSEATDSSFIEPLVPVTVVAASDSNTNMPVAGSAIQSQQVEAAPSQLNATQESRFPGSNASRLLSWPETAYTLQIVAGRSEEGIVNFINAQQNPQRFYRFVTLHQGAPWHVVVYGQYPSRAAALEAVNSLPAEIKSSSPWARTISSVKEDIRKIDQ